MYIKFPHENLNMGGTREFPRTDLYGDYCSMLLEKIQSTWLSIMINFNNIFVIITYKNISFLLWKVFIFTCPTSFPTSSNNRTLYLKNLFFVV